MKHKNRDEWVEYICSDLKKVFDKVLHRRFLWNTLYD